MSEPFAVEVYAPGLGRHHGWLEMERFRKMEWAQEYMEDFARRSPTDKFRVWKYKAPLSPIVWFTLGMWAALILRALREHLI